MDEIIRIEDQWYILAASPKASERVRVLKRGETFAVLDGQGDIFRAGLGELGLYHEGTRHLSRMEFRVCERRPFVLGSSPGGPAGAALSVNLANLDHSVDGHIVLPRDTVHISRGFLLREGTWYQTLRLRNYGMTAVLVPFAFDLEADFADLFEVRGLQRPRRGFLLPPEMTERELLLSYEGLDGLRRRTFLRFSPAPLLLGPRRATFEVQIPARGAVEAILTVDCETGERKAAALPFLEAVACTAEEDRARRLGVPWLESSNRSLDAWLHRSLDDLQMLVTSTPHGDYPYAGIPWFNTPFGRDGILTALEFLWFRPDVARGVLAFLAATQADRSIPDRDAEPGKIVHEIRKGEMAALREIPFERYYGTVDATPLFVALAAAYEECSGDLAFIRGIWPNIERALEWIDRHGDADGDGFVEYASRAPHGLSNQGWKDSHDAIFHADGSLAEGPIALCEVQGYVYQAKTGAARLAERLGIPGRSAALRAEAEALRVRFERSFWLEERSTYALALDGSKRPCRVRSSNAGHALFSEIASPTRAQRVARGLMSHEGYSGWGIRTVASGEARYNPMSYHNGSVWPHDNAVIALGFSRYGMPRSLVLKIMTGLLDATSFTEVHALPELFCGFRRQPGESPVRYPVACSPQAWSAGAAFMLLQATLGLSVHGARRALRFVRPRLPDGVDELKIRDLRVGDGFVDLDLHRYSHNVGIDVVGRKGDVEVTVVK